MAQGIPASRPSPPPLVSAVNIDLAGEGRRGDSAANNFRPKM
jgi:hypothetical protein